MDGFAKWEFNDRRRARESAREALRRLGTAWGNDNLVTVCLCTGSSADGV